MQPLYASLEILSKAIKYKNLTGASLHIGLSQPQISRHINKLEEDLQLNLLFRGSKRHSVWTPAAHELAAVFERSHQKLTHSIQELQLDSQPTQLHIGTLEGLYYLATHLAHWVLENTTTKVVQVDVFDQHEMEAQFTSGELDMSFTSRIPSKQKLKHVLELGHQSFEDYDSNKDYRVYSAYENTQDRRQHRRKLLVSNSLGVRKQWLESYGGKGRLPGQLSKKGELPVLLIANDLINPYIWEQAEKVSLWKDKAK